MNCRLCVVFAFVLFGAASALYECDMDGKLYPNAFNCTQYMQCNYKAGESNRVQREFTSRPCAPGTEFNAKTSVSFFFFKYMKLKLCWFILKEMCFSPCTAMWLSKQFPLRRMQCRYWNLSSSKRWNIQMCCKIKYHELFKKNSFT